MTRVVMALVLLLLSAQTVRGQDTVQLLRDRNAARCTQNDVGWACVTTKDPRERFFKRHPRKPHPTPSPTPVVPPAPAPGVYITAAMSVTQLNAAFAQAMASDLTVYAASGRYELSGTWEWGTGSGFQSALTLIGAGPDATIFDGNGIERFLYMGAPFHGEGFRLEGFVPVDTGMLGQVSGATSYSLTDVKIIGPNVYNQNGHGVYITSAGTVTLLRLTTQNVGGGAVHIYNNEVAVPGLTTAITDSSLHSLHVNLISDEGTTTVTNTRFNGPTEGHVREGGSGTVTLTNSCRTAAGSQYNIGVGSITGTLPVCP